MIFAATLFLNFACGAQGELVYVTNFIKDSNIQTNLIKEFPTGLFFAANAFATPFEITSDTNGHNYNGSGAVTIPCSILSPTDVYTLINAYAPGHGAVATIEFAGSGGASETFTLEGGSDVRDFYQGAFVNTINGTSTENAFAVDNVQDAGGTGNVNTGLNGNYVIDEQHFALGTNFINQTLTRITLAGSGNGTPILLGVTVASEQPFINGLVVAGTNVLIHGANGIAGESVRVLATTDLTLPLIQWAPVATNELGASGSFTITLTNAANSGLNQQFFVLQLE